MIFTLKNRKEYEVPISEFTFVREQILNRWKEIQEINSELSGIDDIPVGTEIFSILDENDQHQIQLLIPGQSKPICLDNKFSSIISLPSYTFLVQKDANSNALYCGAISQEEVRPPRFVYDFKNAFKEGVAFYSTVQKGRKLAVDKFQKNQIYEINDLTHIQLFGKNDRGDVFLITYPRTLIGDITIEFYSISEEKKFLVSTRTVKYRDVKQSIDEFLYQNEFLPLDRNAAAYPFLPESGFLTEPLLLMPMPSLSPKISDLNSAERGSFGIVDTLTLFNAQHYLLVNDAGISIKEHLFSEVCFNAPSDKSDDCQYSVYIYIDGESKRLVYAVRDKTKLEYETVAVDLRFFSEEEKAQILFFSNMDQGIKEAIAQQVFKQIKQDFSRVTLLERLKMAQRCCQTVKNYHDKDLLVVDIHPDNFSFESGQLLDFSGVISSEEGDRAQRIPPLEYCPSEWFASSGDVRPTKASDIFSLGQTFNDIFSSKYNPVAACLQDVMTFSEQEHRLSIDAVLNALEIYIKAHEANQDGLINFIHASFQTFKESFEHGISQGRNKNEFVRVYQQKIISLTSILEIVSKPEQVRFQDDYLAQQTMIELIDKMPHYTQWIAESHIKMLCAENSASKHCAILGSIAYLEKSQHLFSTGRKRVESFVKSVCEGEGSIDLNALRKTAIEGTSKKDNSREKTLSNFGTLENSLMSPANLSRYPILTKISYLLKKDLSNVEKLISHENFKLIEAILLKAIGYMEKTENSFFHHKGRSAVMGFITTIMSTSFLSGSNIEENINNHKLELVYGKSRASLFKEKNMNPSHIPETLRGKTFMAS